MLESYNIQESGYHPFIIREGWQVAQLNYIESQHINNINRIEVHHQTDEVFVLLKGHAVLISVRLQDDHLNFTAHAMQPHITYNVPKNMWHNIAMKEAAEVLIIEKSNTHLNDVEYLQLSDCQIDDLKKEITKL